MKPRPWDKSHPSNFFRDTKEIRLIELEHRVNALEAVIRDRFRNDEALAVPVDARDKVKRRKRGPAPTVSDEHLFYRRESIIDLFEFYWPELRIAFTKKSDHALRPLLQEYARAENGFYASAVRILENLDQLIEFLQSREWNGDPRQAANAMAGVPDIRWSTSLKQCRRIRTDRAINERALRDYLQRNFPQVFRLLLQARTPEEVREVMSRIRTEDREYNWLRDNPEDVAEVLRRGQSGQAR